jgi:hypothetical protein
MTRTTRKDAITSKDWLIAIKEAEGYSFYEHKPNR